MWANIISFYARSQYNLAFANYSSILGGYYNITGDPAQIDHLIGQQSTISGGLVNSTRGNYASITGGTFGIASGTGSSIAGGGWNFAGGDFASVAGGGGTSTVYRNSAEGDYSTVSGGRSNTAQATNSSVGGGNGNTAVYANHNKTGARPDYTSGWQAISPGQMLTFEHNLGGDAGHYIVEVWGKSDNLAEIHQIDYGGRSGYDDSNCGVQVRELNTSSIKVLRFWDDEGPYCYRDWDNVLVRIWAYN